MLFRREERASAKVLRDYVTRITETSAEVLVSLQRFW